MRFNDYAKSIGKTRGYINKLYLEGRLDKAIYEDENGHKRIDKDTADNILSGSKAKETTTPTSVDLEFESLTYDQTRRMKLYNEAKQAKFDLDKDQGKYVAIENMKKDAYKTGLIFRDKVLAVPSQISPKLAEMKSPFDIKNLLLEYLTKAIESAITTKFDQEENYDEKEANV